MIRCLGFNRNSINGIYRITNNNWNRTRSASFHVIHRKYCDNEYDKIYKNNIDRLNFSYGFVMPSLSSSAGSVKRSYFSSIPNSKPKTAVKTIAANVASFDSRANAKIEALHRQLEEMDSSSLSGEETVSAISGAYAQAIKYVSRSRHKDAALFCTNLLSEAIERAGGKFIPPPNRNITEARSSEIEIETQWRDVYRALEKLEGYNGSESKCAHSDRRCNGDDDLYIIPPDLKSFHQTLHAWGDSKVRRKGVFANNLLKNMILLAATERYPMFDTMPDSKAFAIAIKCWSGSTHRYSFQNILQLHKLHEQLADLGVNGIVRNDPLFLMHSIKCVKNYTYKNQEKWLSEWFDRLHKSVLTKAENTIPETIDLTGTYTGIIRQYAKAKLKFSGQKAVQVLERMQELQSSENGIASIEIQQNAYDLTLSALRDTKNQKSTMKSIEIVTKVVEKYLSSDKSNKPAISNDSFVYCLQSLSSISDKKEAYQHARKIISWVNQLQSSKGIDFSVEPYTALIYFYANKGDTDILSNVSFVLSSLEEYSENQNHDVRSGMKSALSAVLRACSQSHSSCQRKEAISMSLETFNTLLKDEEEGHYHISDDCYFHMMKCYENLMPEKEEKIISTFMDAARKGLVSKNVLKALRTNISADKYEEIVGSGRIADDWVKNVDKSGANVVLYTDGTSGGEGKNARRKGKSTSDWLRKQKTKEQKKITAKARKRQKRMIKLQSA